MSDGPAVLQERDGAVQRLILNRDEYRNALSEELIKGLMSGLEQAENDPEVNVIVVAANGRAFCAGAKLDALSERNDPVVAREYHMKALDVFRGLLHCRKPTIAQVHGHALAGGAGVATCCDFVLCAPEANFGYPEIEIAAAPSMVMQVLLRRVPWRVGLGWVMSGERIEAEDAVRWGLASEVVPAEDLRRRTDELAASLAARDSGALKIIKELAIVGPDMPFERSLRYAAEMSAIATSSDTAREEIAAFFASRDSRATEDAAR